MRKLVVIFGLIGLLAACSTGLRAPAPANPHGDGPRVDAGGNYIEGQVIVGYAAGASADSLAAWLGGQVLQDWTPVRIAVIALPERLTVEKAVGLLARRPGVRYAEPNRVYPKVEPEPAVNPTGVDAMGLYSDPDFYKQWMHRQMNTEAAWAEGVTGAGVRIGIHDDFVDHRHPDLVGNIAYPGFYGTTAELICPDTPHNGLGTHGSSVAGTAAGVANRIGGRGIAYEASIVPIAIDHPTEGFLTSVGIINGALFAALGPEALGIPVPEGCGGYTPPDGRPYVDIVNMSWGGGVYSQATKDVMDFMLAYGVVLVTSAGNTPTTGFAEPAWFPGLITVAATQANGHRTDFSNRGVHLDVAAPGQNIWVPTTRHCILIDPTGASCTGDEADYTYIGGTSFSSPATAGAAALVLQAAGGAGTLDARQVRAILSETANDANADEYPGFDQDLGWGIVDAGAAVAKALAIRAGDEDAPAPAANLDIYVTDANTGTPLPLTGAALQPVDADDQPLTDRPILLSQTTGSGVFSDAGWASFYQIDPGRYAVFVSGPHWKKTGIVPGLAAGVITVPSGNWQLPIELDVQLPTDPYEPNDDTGSATPVSVGMTYKGILYADGGGDVDYYALPVTSGTSYYVNSETLSGSADLVLTVLDSDGSTVIAQNDNNQDFSKDALVTFTAAADATYYLKVEDGGNGNSPFNAYALDIATGTVAESEPNGAASVSGTAITGVDLTDAQSVALGSVVAASLDPSGDDDIFAVTLTAGATLVVDAETASNGVPDTMVAVYDAGGTQLAFNDDFTGRESRLEFEPGADGTYYVLVTAWDGDGPDGTTGDYTLSLTTLDTP